MTPTSLPRQEEKRPEIDWQQVANRAAISAFDKVDELAEQLGVAPESLCSLFVGRGQDEFGDRRGWWSFPMRTGQLKVTGIVRRYHDGAKKTMRWSRQGLFLAPNWWRAEGPILLVEGPTDTAALLTLGLCVIGRPSNVGGVNLLIGLLRPYKKRTIIVIGERDQKSDGCPKKCGTCLRCWPGWAGAVQTAKALSESLKRPILVALPPPEHKDVRAAVNAGIGRERLLNQLRAKQP